MPGERKFTLMGRKHFLPDINASNQQERTFAERTAINATIQALRLI